MHKKKIDYPYPVVMQLEYYLSANKLSFSKDY